jgi:outer membrane protein OmpA-like peptidoglycan-associated protein
MMAAGKIGRREADGAGVPQAWVWSQYRGRLLTQIERKRDIDQADLMLFEQKGLRPFGTALGLAIAVAIILGLVWLFTPQVPSSPIMGSASKVNDLESQSVDGEKSVETVPAPPPQSEAAANDGEKSVETAPAPLPQSEAAANASPKSVEAPDFETRLRSFLANGPGKEASFELGRVAFNPGAATLTAAAREELQKLAETLREYPGTHAVVGVHSDAGGSAKQTARLSARRAKTVRRELMRLGIGHSFVTVAHEARASLRASTPARPGYVWIDVRKK